ncbi:MAG: cyclic nucleotide-binding domain-containing protein [Bacteroidia bacterium]|nr:cyclic nucleotide-binding domain-containing protein [Bacteroidia bacterium]
MKPLRKSVIDIENRVTILHKVSIFSQTDTSVLREIAEAMSELRLKTEQTLFDKGEVGREMYVIVEGAVRVHDGAYVFAVLRQGQVVGEYSLLESEASFRSASVTAIVPTYLLRLRQSVFYELMAHRIEIVKGYFKCAHQAVPPSKLLRREIVRTEPGVGETAGFNQTGKRKIGEVIAQYSSGRGCRRT